MSHPAVCFVLSPGAVAAGGTISLPGYVPRLAKLLSFVLVRRNAITWSGLGAAGATIATRDVAAAASGTDLLGECVPKEVVDAAPAAGQVQLRDPKTIVVGDAINDGDHVVIVGVALGAYSGV